MIRAHNCSSYYVQLMKYLMDLRLVLWLLIIDYDDESIYVRFMNLNMWELLVLY